MRLKSLALLGAMSAGLAVAPVAEAHSYRYGYRSYCTARIHDNGTTGDILGTTLYSIDRPSASKHLWTKCRKPGPRDDI